MTGFSSLLCYPFPVLLINIHGDSDDPVEGVVDIVDLSEPVFDKDGQVFPILDQLVVVTQPYAIGMLFE